MKLSRIMHALLVAARFSIPLSLVANAMASPQPQQQEPVSFVSGGVGEDEERAIERLVPDYPLQLLFVTKGEPNQYLADVKVQIKDKSGNVVLDTTADGPFLLAKMPLGKYSISADHEGAVKRQTIHVGGKAQRVVFVWDR